MANKAQQAEERGTLPQFEKDKKNITISHDFSHGHEHKQTYKCTHTHTTLHKSEKDLSSHRGNENKIEITSPSLSRFSLCDEQQSTEPKKNEKMFNVSKQKQSNPTI